MLPEHLLESENRISNYKINNDLYNGDHYKVFNFDEQETKVNDFEYICYGIINQAISIKTDLIWRESPDIKFQSEAVQIEFDRLRKETNFDYINRQSTVYHYLFGDSIVKIAVDENNLTAEDDLQLKLYLIDPCIWYPDYNKFSPQKDAKTNTLLLKKEIDKEGTAYLLESHQPGKIIWTSFFEKSNNQDKEAVQIPVLRYFANEMDGVVAKGGNQENALELEFDTMCNYSLIQRLKGKTTIDSYFGKSNITLPVKSKLNALNNYANLADVIIVTNSFPKLILSENASNILKRITEEYNNNALSTGQDPNQEPSTELVGIDFTKSTGKTFLSRQNYANSYIFRKLVNDMRAFEDGSRGGQTKYLTNDFSLEEIRKQHEIYFNSLMSEMDISEVFYNPSLITGNLSGIAYKRLMSKTLNAVDNSKRTLEPYIARQAFTMMQLAKVNNLTEVTAEMPEVLFHDGIINDEKEELELIIMKVQNDLLPLKEAMAQANKMSIDQIEKWMSEMEDPEISEDEGEDITSD